MPCLARRIVFPSINVAWREHLYRYMSGILDQRHGHLIRAGGVADHVHLLLRLSPATAVSDVMRLIKSNSAKWIHETFDQQKLFAWQTGYGAFSVSQSMEAEVRKYIDSQEEHHRKMTFEEEYLAMLKRHDITFDERYAWD